MKKLILTLILASVSTLAFSGNYTSNGKDVFYKGKKIGFAEKTWTGWTGYCIRRERGSVRAYSTKDKAIQSIVNECKTNWVW